MSSKGPPLFRAWIALVLGGVLVASCSSSEVSQDDGFCLVVQDYGDAVRALGAAMAELDSSDSGRAPDVFIEAVEAATAATQRAAAEAPREEREDWERLASLRQFLLAEWEELDFAATFWADKALIDKVMLRSPVQTNGDVIMSRVEQRTADLCGPDWRTGG